MKWIRLHRPTMRDVSRGRYPQQAPSDVRTFATTQSRSTRPLALVFETAAKGRPRPERTMQVPGRAEETAFNRRNTESTCEYTFWSPLLSRSQTWTDVTSCSDGKKTNMMVPRIYRWCYYDERSNCYRGRTGHGLMKRPDPPTWMSCSSFVCGV